ncbi:hypothetical protein [Cupriavidus taiwanensis]|uniref:hypothetical protein n=1 Tax=Cupriavidus taiwanensis TaxID=164546 RepID=UPI000E1504F5|nr:hypothetical protein [Cupriavidus taiwanensis]SOY44454.1 hypothetical protein CBM2585_A130041 [Cupriavidus taiwanensis]
MPIILQVVVQDEGGDPATITKIAKFDPHDPNKSAQHLLSLIIGRCFTLILLAQFFLNSSGITLRPFYWTLRP